MPGGVGPEGLRAILITDGVSCPINELVFKVSGRWEVLAVAMELGVAAAGAEGVARVVVALR
jgi:hypothetical protein